MLEDCTEWVWGLCVVLQADPIRVLVTGAAGQIAYSLLYSIAKGDVFGKDQVTRPTSICSLSLFQIIFGLERAQEADGCYNMLAIMTLLHKHVWIIHGMCIFDEVGRGRSHIFGRGECRSLFAFVSVLAHHLGPAGHPSHVASSGWGCDGATGLCSPTPQGWAMLFYSAWAGSENICTHYTQACFTFCVLPHLKPI